MSPSANTAGLSVQRLFDSRLLVLLEAMLNTMSSVEVCFKQALHY